MANAMKFYRSGHQSGAGDSSLSSEGKLFALAFWAPLVSSAPMLCLGSGTHVLALARSKKIEVAADIREAKQILGKVLP